MSTNSTTSISSMLNSKNRIFGLSSGSGLDVDSLVEKLMQAEETKVNKVKQQKTYLEWQKDAYREFTTSLTSLKNKYMNITSSTNMISTSSFNKTKATVSDSTVVSAASTSSAGEVTHNISVSQIATVGAVAGSNLSGDITESTKIKDLLGGTLTTDTVLLTINDPSNTTDPNHEIKYLSDTETISQFISRVNNDSSNNTYRLSFDSTDKKFVLTTKNTGEDISAGISGEFLEKTGFSDTIPTEGGELTFIDADWVAYRSAHSTADSPALTIGDTKYSINSNETFDDFIKRVSDDANNEGYTFTLEDKHIVITKKDTNPSGDITVSGDFLEFTNVANSGTTSYSILSGKNASFKIDGISYSSTTNTYTTGGITYTLLKEGPSNVVTTRDIDTIVKNIQDFVTDYNKIIDNLNTKLTEKKYRDYTPLTDEQKEQMKDSDITLWETKAKSGLLRGDTLLTGIGDKLKEVMYSQYTLSDGSKISLSEIGIGSTSYLDKGKLTVDETKLRAALTDTPDKVAELLGKQSSISYSPDGDNSERHSQNGIFANVSDVLNDYVRTIRDSSDNKGLLLQKAGTTDDTTEYDNAIDKLIDEKEDQIEDLLDKLEDKQDYYYKKFTAMESAISTMNSQASSLTSMLGG